MGKLFNISDWRNFSPIYIETGTAAGGSMKRADAAGFKRLATIEADEGWFNHFNSYVLKTLKTHSTITLGNSYEQLPMVLIDVALISPAVIFLDAHPAGPNTAGHNELLAGDNSYGQDAILTKEIEAILRHRNDHLIIIDDQNGWTDESVKYSERLKKANPNYTFEFFDECLEDGIYRANKIMVCVP
jgi:hypothetical protein